MSEAKHVTPVGRFKYVMQFAVQFEWVPNYATTTYSDNYFVRKTLKQHNRDHMDWVIRDIIKDDWLRELPRGVSYDMVLEIAIKMGNQRTVDFARLMGGKTQQEREAQEKELPPSPKKQRL